MEVPWSIDHRVCCMNLPGTPAATRPDVPRGFAEGSPAASRRTSAPGMVLALVVLLMLGWVTTKAVDQMPSFDGAMNLQVSWSLAEGEGYRRTYADRGLFPREVQTNVPVTVPAALAYRVFGMGVWQSQLVNLLYLYALAGLGFLLVARRFGLVAGAVAALFLIVTPGVVFGGLRGLGEIPALAWTFAALCLLPWRQGQRWHALALVLAGTCLGLALATKTVIAICIGAIGLCVVVAVLADGREQRRRRVALCVGLVAGFVLPLLAIEAWRMATLGSAADWHAWWLLQLASIDAQTGMRTTPDSLAAYLEKGASHLEALGRFYGLRPLVALAWLAMPFLLALLAARAHGVQRRHLPLLSLLLATALYFFWWLLLTPDNKVWHRRILDGSLMLNLAWVYVSAWLILGTGARWARGVGLGAATVAAAYFAVFAYARFIPAVTGPGPSDDYRGAVELVRNLPADARIYGFGWNSAPQISLLSGRSFGDFNDQTRATLDTGDPVYVVVDTPGISARSHATALATYPSQALMEGAKRTQVYRLDPSRLLPAKRGDADVAQSFVSLSGTAYPLKGGFGARHGGGVWMAPDAFVRLRYDGSRDIVLDLRGEGADGFRRREAVTVSLELDGCALGSRVVQDAGWQQARIAIPANCVPELDALATLRISSSDVLDQYIGRGGAARSIVLRAVGFAPSCAQDTCPLPKPRTHTVKSPSPRGMLQGHTPAIACAPDYGLEIKLDWNATSTAHRRVELLLRSRSGSTKTWAGSQPPRGTRRTGPWMRPGMAIVLTSPDGGIIDQWDYPLRPCDAADP